MKPLNKINQYEVISIIYAREDYACYRCVGPDDRNYVIKAFDLSLLENASAELKAARQLQDINHPNLVRIIEVKRDTKLKIYYYVMECWGEDLRDTIKVKADPNIALEIIKQVLEGLGELHKKVGAHRDIKPENIFIKNGVAKLGDYGLVKSQRLITKLTTIAGTRDYMAPEVASGKYNERCDIYSVGVVLLELLTGSREIPKSKPDNIKQWFWNNLIIKAIAQDPNERFNSIDDFIKTFIEEVPYFDSFDLRPFKREPNHKDAKKAKVKDTPPAPLNRGDSLGDLSVSAVKSPIFQKLEIQRYPPKPEMRNADDPGVLAKALQTKFDELSKGNDYKAMLPVAGELAKAVETKFTKQNSRTADAYDKLAFCYLELGNYQKAEENYRIALSIDQSLYGIASRQYLNSHYHLAEVFRLAGDNKKAYEIYQFMLKTSQSYLKNTDDDAIVRNNFGCINYHLKDYPTALDLYQQALTINEKKNRVSEAVVINLYNLSITYEAMGNAPSAKALGEKALEIGKTIYRGVKNLSDLYKLILAPEIKVD
ncbi:MAG: serine/threonine-protein kinase [Planctomycetota bacterium]